MWVADPLNETKRVLIENFVINGSQVVWVSESNQSVFPNKSNITINDIYGTNLQNGPFYALIYGPSVMNRILPSNGPGELSSQDTIFASGSYSTILNVPNYDQTNDLFKPILSLLPKEYEFTIFTRWGEQIFKTIDYKDGWDGIYNGNLVGDGVYTLKLLINNKAYTQSFTVMSAN